MTPERELLEALARRVTKRTVERIIRRPRSFGPDRGANGANVWEDLCVQVQGEQSVFWCHASLLLHPRALDFPHHEWRIARD